MNPLPGSPEAKREAEDALADAVQNLRERANSYDSPLLASRVMDAAFALADAIDAERADPVCIWFYNGEICHEPQQDGPSQFCPRHTDAVMERISRGSR